MAHILIIDDSAFARSLLKNNLVAAGHTVTEASSGLEALELVRTLQPEIITIDLLMPGMEGLELLGHLRRVNPKFRIIVISADIQTTTREELLSAGADAFLNKPVDTPALLQTIERLLA
jgi:two-component system chemotaxis response regulator CheY